VRLHVYPLDAVRFFAAFSVLAFHLAFYAWAAPHSVVGAMYERAADFPSLAPYAWFGWVGVEIFFVISGFVIANSANGASPIAFARSRVLRLYPAVWVCALITLAAWVFIDGEALQHLWRELFNSITLWIQGPWIDGVYWSLAVEMVFYALIFLLLAVGRFSSLPWLAGGLVVYSAVFLVLKAAGNDALSAIGLWRVLSAHENPLLLRYGCFFGVGMFMWLSTVRRLRAREWLAAAIGVVACCLEIVLRSAGVALVETHTGVPMSPIIPLTIWLAVVALMFVFARTPERFTPRAQRSRAVLQHLGKMTYPLYLTHSVVGAGVMRLLIEAGVDRWAALAVGASAMLLAASLIALLAEPAVRNLLRTGWDRAEAAVRGRVFAFLFRSGGAVEPSS
jgi:exopolysaccharide production protein ExoZ